MKHLISILGLVAGLPVATGSLAEDRPAPVGVGAKVPDFSVLDLTGKEWRLADLQKRSASRAVLLTFWCSFCHSCRDIEADLDRLAGKFKGKATVVALDASAGETATRVARFAKQKGLTLPIMLDAPGKTADLFGARVTTTTVLIDGAGVLRYRGQFAHGQHGYAQAALGAVLAGKEVDPKETPPHG